MLNTHAHKYKLHMTPPTVKELVASNRAGIDRLREDNREFDAVDIGVPYDDLFVLRFLLSAKGDVKVAGRKLTETLKWRAANLASLNLAGSGQIPHRATINVHFREGIVGWVGNDLVTCIRTGLGDMPAMIAALSEDELLLFLVSLNEANFRLVDERTREVGMLCKVVSAVDFYGFAMSRLSRKFGPIMGKSSHASNVYYPQLLRYTVFINLPTALRLMLSAFSAFLPKETSEKQRICSGRPHAGKQTAADCPYLKASAGSGEAALKLMPQFMGGTAPTPATLRHDSDKAQGWLL